MSDQDTSDQGDQHTKLWVGNIPRKLSEYQLLKILEQCGSVAQFDFLYNITDDGKRSPRGYAFVTFSSVVSAEKAIKSLNKTDILGREVIVRLANPKTDPDHSKSERKIIPAALKAGSKQSLSQSEKSEKIKQLEAKLKRMEQSTSQDFKVSTSSSNSSTTRYCPYTKSSKS